MKSLLFVVFTLFTITSCSNPMDKADVREHRSEIFELSPVTLNTTLVNGVNTIPSSSLDFASLEYEQTVTQDIIIINKQLSALTFSADDFIIDSISPFSVTSNTCLSFGIIERSRSCKIVIELKNATQLQNNVQLNKSLSIKGSVINLTGEQKKYVASTLPLPNMIISPMSLDFGTLKDLESKELTILLNNKTPTTQPFVLPIISNPKLTITNACPSSILRNRRCSIKIKYTASIDEVISNQDIFSLYNNPITYSVIVASPTVEEPQILNVEPIVPSISVSLTEPEINQYTINFENNGTIELVNPVIGKSSQEGVVINSVSCSGGLARNRICSISYSLDSTKLPAGVSSQSLKLQSGTLASTDFIINLNITKSSVACLPADALLNQVNFDNSNQSLVGLKNGTNVSECLLSSSACNPNYQISADSKSCQPISISCLEADVILNEWSIIGAASYSGTKIGNNVSDCNVATCISNFKEVNSLLKKCEDKSVQNPSFAIINKNVNGYVNAYELNLDNISALNAQEMKISESSNCSGSNTWQAISSTAQMSIGTPIQISKVSIAFRNGSKEVCHHVAGIITNVNSHEYIHDAQNPTITNLIPLSGSSSESAIISLDGNCSENDMQVVLTGDIVPSPSVINCNTNSFSNPLLNLTSGEGLKIISITHQDLAGNVANVAYSINKILPVEYNVALKIIKNDTYAKGKIIVEGLLDCGDTCNQIFNTEAMISLIATEDAGSKFVGWEGDCEYAESDADCSMMVNQDLNIQAKFETTQIVEGGSISFPDEATSIAAQGDNFLVTGPNAKTHRILGSTGFKDATFPDLPSSDSVVVLNDNSFIIAGHGITGGLYSPSGIYIKPYALHNNRVETSFGNYFMSTNASSTSVLKYLNTNPGQAVSNTFVSGGNGVIKFLGYSGTQSYFAVIVAAASSSSVTIFKDTNMTTNQAITTLGNFNVPAMVSDIVIQEDESVIIGVKPYQNDTTAAGGYRQLPSTIPFVTANNITTTQVQDAYPAIKYTKITDGYSLDNAFLTNLGKATAMVSSVSSSCLDVALRKNGPGVLDDEFYCMGIFSFIKGTRVSSFIKFDTSGNLNFVNLPKLNEKPLPLVSSGLTVCSSTCFHDLVANDNGLMVLINDGVGNGNKLESINGIGVNTVAKIKNDGTLDTNFNSGTSNSRTMGFVGNYAIGLDSFLNGQFCDGMSISDYAGIVSPAFKSANNKCFSVNPTTVGTISTTTNSSGFMYFANNDANSFFIMPNMPHKNADPGIEYTQLISQYNGQSIRAVMKMKLDGTIDSTFQSGLYGYTTGNPRYILKGSDGLYVFGKHATTSTGTAVSGPFKLNLTTGALIAGWPVGTGTGVSAATMFIAPTAIQQSTGKIITGMSRDYNGVKLATVSGVDYLSFYRLNTNATLDSTFSRTYGTVGDLKVVKSNDDSFYLVGRFSYQLTAKLNGVEQVINKPGVIKYNADGTVDPTFYANSGTGFTCSTCGWSSGIAAVNDAAIDSLGNIIIVGDLPTFNGVSINGLIKINTDGTINTTFLNNIGTSFQGTVKPTKIILRPDGKIFLQGSRLKLFNGQRISNTLLLNQDGTIAQ